MRFAPESVIPFLEREREEREVLRSRAEGFGERLADRIDLKRLFVLLRGLRGGPVAMWEAPSSAIELEL